MLYLRARGYDPQIGRFVSADPFEGRQGDPRSLNRYLYASSDPVQKTDPSGEMSLGELGTAMDIQATMRTVLPTVGKGALSLAASWDIHWVLEWSTARIRGLPIPHGAVYAEKTGTSSGLRYDVGPGSASAFERVSRRWFKAESGFVIHVDHATTAEVRGLKFKTAHLKPHQYLIWHVTALSIPREEACSLGPVTVPFLYRLIPGPNCLTWSLEAAALARIVQFFK